MLGRSVQMDAAVEDPPFVEKDAERDGGELGKKLPVIGDSASGDTSEFSTCFQVSSANLNASFTVDQSSTVVMNHWKHARQRS